MSACSKMNSKNSNIAGIMPNRQNVGKHAFYTNSTNAFLIFLCILATPTSCTTSITLVGTNTLTKWVVNLSLSLSLSLSLYNETTLSKSGQQLVLPPIVHIQKSRAKTNKRQVIITNQYSTTTIAG
jgi:hypothetical protein